MIDYHLTWQKKAIHESSSMLEYSGCAAQTHRHEP